jgi:transposase
MTTKKKPAAPKAKRPKKPEWEPRKRPHKAKLTPAVAARIIRMLKAGNYLQTAASAAGVHKNTLTNWMKWGADEFNEDGTLKKKGREPFRSFVFDLEEAISDGEQSLVASINASGWKGKMEILARRFPERWGRTNRVQLTGANDGPIVTKAEGAPPIINVTVSGGDGANPFRFIATPVDEEEQ